MLNCKKDYILYIKPKLVPEAHAKDYDKRRAIFKEV